MLYINCRCDFNRSCLYICEYMYDILGNPIIYCEVYEDNFFVFLSSVVNIKASSSKIISDRNCLAFI